MEEGEILNNQDYYLSLPHDMSGSMSKNRFRMELLWGISKMLDLYDDKDFTMVFDYACDIEVHVKDGFEFYQIKTHSGNKSYTWKKLTNVKGEGSILGKLYILDKAHDNLDIKLAVVSNAPLSIEKNIEMTLEYCFDSLPEEEKAGVITALKSELSVDEVDLSKVFFIHTNMNLEDPKNEIMGKLIISFQRIKNCEPSNPNALYRLIYDTVVDKACYEYSDEEYEDIIAHKGLSKAEFDKMLDAHAANARTGIRQAEEYIDRLKDIKAKRMYKKALPAIMKPMCSSLPLKQLEQKIGSYLVLHEDDVTDIEAGIELLISAYHDTFPVEFSNAEKVMFYVVILNRFIEGVYDV